jgi:hypothetical protein
MHFHLLMFCFLFPFFALILLVPMCFVILSLMMYIICMHNAIVLKGIANSELSDADWLAGWAAFLRQLQLLLLPAQK